MSRISVVILVTLCGCNLLGLNKGAAEEHAREWAREVGLPAERIVCGSSDTDNDGYVSCTFTVKGTPHTFECAGYTFLVPHDGCREPKVKIPSTR